MPGMYKYVPYPGLYECLVTSGYVIVSIKTIFNSNNENNSGQYKYYNV